MLIPTKYTKGFDLNADKLFAKARYNTNEPSKLGKFPSKDITRQAHEGLGYIQPPPVRIFVRITSNNYITIGDESTSSNKRLSVFNQQG